MNFLRSKGGRDFKFNGRKFHVMDCAKQDREDEKKYHLCEVDENDVFHILYDNTDWSIPKFRTIKEARMFVRSFDFLLEKF